jgi:hypothetical protein
VDLAKAVTAYLKATGGFDRPLHLSRFGLSKLETEQLFSAWDEDYQISRYMILTRAPEDELANLSPASRTYAVNGHETSHVAFRAEVQRLFTSR